MDSLVDADASPDSGEGIASEEAASRTPPRVVLTMTAALRLGSERDAQEVRMRNLSPGGVMVECAEVREPGTPVLLAMASVGGVAGRIAWCTAGRMGIAFDRPVDPARVQNGGTAI